MAPSVRVVARVFFAAIVVVSALTLAAGYVAERTAGEGAAYGDQASVHRSQGAKGPSNVTVVTTSERQKGGDRANLITAVAPNGTVLYRNNSLRVYNDVDPVPGTENTVIYVGAERLSRSECDATTACWRNVVERVNLSTGETSRVYSHITSMKWGQWHDIDQMNDSRILVADIALDRVFVVNTTTGIVEWEWQAQSAFPLSGGGLFPGDWTHVNDVELLDDGRIMASLRNQDQVVFIDPETGLMENWTLGSEDAHDTLYEQHNPDFIPPRNGGPAVLVADSENDRVVEYRRTNAGRWKQSWAWRDVTLQWPRDADRLPSGNTLVTDTNGGRVVEVNPQGKVVWRMEISGAYDSERLGTGDESAGGPSASDGKMAFASGAAATPNAPERGGSRGLSERVLLTLKDYFPDMVLNPVLYVLPAWIGFVELCAILLLLATAVAWSLAEFWWSPWHVGLARSR